MLKSWSLRLKLITIFLVMGITPLAITMAVSYYSTDREIHAQAIDRVVNLAADKKHRIEGYFNREFDALVDMAHSHGVKAAIVEFAKVFETYKNHVPSAQDKAKVEEFYERLFAAEYTKNNPGENFDVKGYVSELDDGTINAQFDFIANNDNPLGEKNKQITAKRNVPYNGPHATFHPEFADYLKRHELYDLFLVTPDGRIVYTVFKETDFGYNLARGRLSSSGLARAYNKSLGLAAGEIYLDDFSRYSQSYEAPASFASTPIFDNGKLLGTLIIQLPLNKISEIASDRLGLGELGQVLLFGQDGRLRADAFRQKEIYNVAASFKKNSTVKMESVIISAAIAGKSGTEQGIDYDGVSVIASFEPIKIANLQWAVISELSEAEVYEGLNHLHNIYIFIIIFGLVVITGAAWITSRSIALNLQKIIETLTDSSRQVSSASTEAESSAATLSQAATEQAASLQETMASAEEISAMINQNAESANKAKMTVEANDQATRDGSAAVVEMVAAIGEIKVTNEEILQQMEASNKEFSEIVQIISEIGDKTKVINDIVFQTKLLSFNASVEAARAGEHGKGFAVVAEEVGNLAQMSGNAAKEITDMLSASIKRVNTIVEQTKAKVEHLVEVGKDKITMGQSTADRCRTALDKLTKNASTLTAMVTEIAHASKEQAQGVREINSAISQLDQVTQQNSAVAQQSSSQADSLLKETHSLNGAVNLLVTFVQGQNTLKNVTPEATGNIPTVGIRATPTATSKQVVSLETFKKKTPVPKREAQNVSRENKIAAGSDITPSNNNPGFEEF